MQLQVIWAREDLNSSKDRVEASMEEEAQIVEEIKQMTQVADSANLRVEALLDQIEANESDEVEKARINNLEQVSAGSAQKMDNVWLLELEEAEKRLVLYEETLSFAFEEIERFKQELSLEITQKKAAFQEAEDARVAAVTGVQQIKELASEVKALSRSPRVAIINGTAMEDKLAANAHFIEKLINVNQTAKEDKLAGNAHSMEKLILEQRNVRKNPKQELRNAKELTNAKEKLKLELRTAREGTMHLLSESKIRIKELEMEVERAKYSEAELLMEVAKAKDSEVQLLMDAENAKESEARMLGYLTCQTKQLEETKISHEEAKLEIAYLNKGAECPCKKHSRSHSRCRQCRKIEELEESVRMLQSGLKIMKEDLVRSKDREELAVTKESALAEEVKLLKSRLKLAKVAEEINKKSMDDFALALKEVMTEANQAEEKLAAAESELQNWKMQKDLNGRASSTSLRNTVGFCLPAVVGAKDTKSQAVAEEDEDRKEAMAFTSLDNSKVLSLSPLKSAPLIDEEGTCESNAGSSVARDMKKRAGVQKFRRLLAVATARKKEVLNNSDS